ncbi:MAG: DUF417 family protein [Hyphomicrobium sp.]|nr:DUF417 family protein [Hyphomicrobium sp.]
MLPSFWIATDRAIAGIDRLVPAERFTAVGRGIALAGVVLPLFLIGILKFTSIEVEVLKPLISNTPWLSWLYPAFGEPGAAALLGVAEVFTAALLLASPWFPRAGVLGGAFGAVTFAVTSSTMLALPIWEAGSGGFPFLDATGSFLIKDIVMLGVSVVVLGDSLARLRAR